MTQNQFLSMLLFISRSWGQFHSPSVLHSTVLTLWMATVGMGYFPTSCWTLPAETSPAPSMSCIRRCLREEGAGTGCTTCCAPCPSLAAGEAQVVRQLLHPTGSSPGLLGTGMTRSLNRESVERHKGDQGLELSYQDCRSRPCLV